MKNNNNKNNNRRKRVAMISVHSDPLAKLGGHHTGGQNVYVMEVSRYLGHLGWSVDIFTRQTRKRKQLIKNIGKNVRVIYIKAGSRHYVFRDKLFDTLPEFLGNVLTFKTENKLDYNIIHGNYYLEGWVAAQLKNALRVPMVQTFHSLGHVRNNALIRLGQEPDDSELFKNRIRSEKEVMQASDFIIATNPREKEDILNYYDFNFENKTTIIPCGVNLKRFRKVSMDTARNTINGFSKETKIIMYIGRLDQRKGIETLLRSFPLVLNNFPSHKENFKVIIIGGKLGKKADPDDKREMRRLEGIAKEMGIEQQTNFWGRRNQERLRYYYSSADVCVIPSYYEPFGLTALEAMRCGTPVVASNVGGLTFTVQDNKTGLSFPAKDEKQLAEKITSLLKNQKLRERVCENAYVFASEFGWKKIVSDISKLYQQLLIKK